VGFVVRQSDNRSFGWISKPLPPADVAETGPRVVGPRNRADVFATREEAQQRIDNIRQRESRTFRFEIQPE